MPGTYDQLSRRYNKSVIPVWMGDLDNVDVTPGSDVTVFSVPYTCQIVGIIVNNTAGTASSQFTADILRGGGVGVGTVIASSASTGVAATTCTTGLSVYLEQCEPLNLVVRGSDADTDDFTDAQIWLVVQTPVDENAA